MDGYYDQIISLLYGAFGGPYSELTQTLQVHNHHMHYMVFEPKGVGPILEKIGDQDMHHLHVLAVILLKKDYEIPYVSPSYTGWTYWNSSYVYVGTGLFDRLESDIKLKENTIAIYDGILMKNPDESTKRSIERIRAEEYKHIRILQDLINRYSKKHIDP